MALFKPIGQRDGITGVRQFGDLEFKYYNFNNNLVVSADADILASQMIEQYIICGGSGGFNATFPSSSDLYTALLNSSGQLNVEEGTGFLLNIINNTSDTITLQDSVDGSMGGLGGFPLNPAKGIETVVQFNSIQPPTAAAVSATNTEDILVLESPNPFQTSVGAPLFGLAPVVRLGGLVLPDGVIFSGPVQVIAVNSGLNGPISFQVNAAAEATEKTSVTIVPYVTLNPLKIYDYPS